MYHMKWIYLCINGKDPIRLKTGLMMFSQAAQFGHITLVIHLKMCLDAIPQPHSWCRLCRLFHGLLSDIKIRHCLFAFWLKWVLDWGCNEGRKAWGHFVQYMDASTDQSAGSHPECLCLTVFWRLCLKSICTGYLFLCRYITVLLFLCQEYKNVN